MDFIRLAADALEPLLDRVTQIGICFSYPAENTPELDAKVLGMTKEVQLTGWEDHLVGADLAEELERRGCTKLPITVINDTPATYLSGSTTIANNYANGFAGLVNGTGTNTCCLLPVRAIEKLGRDADGEMLVNLESGSFTDVPQSAFDKALDAASAAPGAYRFEKMTSGRYLGKLSRLALIAAAKDGLFAPETADKLRALDVLTAADADAFGADPDCGAIAALSDAADADRKTAAMVIQSVFGRAAKAIVANIAAIVFLTDGAKTATARWSWPWTGRCFATRRSCARPSAKSSRHFSCRSTSATACASPYRTLPPSARPPHPCCRTDTRQKKPDVTDIRLFASKW